VQDQQTGGPLGAIAQFASSPAGVFAGLLAAAKSAATFGTELDILSQERRDVLLYLLGATQGMSVAGIQYYLGSSRGSKDKTQMFERLTEK
jgi:hypothetical protein